MTQGRGTARKKPIMYEGRSSSSGQLHIDLGALAQRVTFTEEAVRNIGSQLTGLREDMQRSNDSLADKLGKRIDQQTPKGTPWLQVVAVMFSGFAIAGGFWAYSTTQNNANVARIEALVVAEAAERKGENKDLNTLMQPILAAVAQQKNDAKQFEEIKTSISGLWEKEWPKVAQDEYEKRIDDHNALVEKYAARDLAELKVRVEGIDSTIIKRPEIESSQKSQNDRIDALSSRLTATEQEVHSGWSLADTVKSLETRIENLRIQFGTALIPAAPTIPAK